MKIAYKVPRSANSKDVFCFTEETGVLVDVYFNGRKIDAVIQDRDKTIVHWPSGWLLAPSRPEDLDLSAQERFDRCLENFGTDIFLINLANAPVINQWRPFEDSQSGEAL